MPFDSNYGMNVGGHKVQFNSSGALVTDSSGVAAEEYADATAIQGIASSTRTDGMLVVKLDDSTTWIFDAESSASSSSWVIVPTAGTGRWLRSEASTADLISTSSGKGASLVGIQDAGAFTAAATVEAALAEVYQDIKSVQKQFNAPSLAGGILAAGTPLAAFADNASSNPGITLANSKAVAVRWNNNASQTAVWYSVPFPQDVDDTADVVMHILASKSGATVGDATTFTVSAFFQTVGALHDADSDLGGTSGALVGNATAKTVAEVTLTLASAEVPASPCTLSFSIKPTDGTLGTDDALVEGIWFEYKGKLLTS